jgi:subtilisin family serine protease
MLALLLPLLGAAAVPADASAGVPVVAPINGVAVPDSYIVEVREGVDPTAVARLAGVTPRYVYTEALNGFAGTFSKAEVAVLQRLPQVTHIEQVQVVSKSTTQNTVFSGWDVWGLDRIDQNLLPLSSTYTYNSNGAGVTAYVFDSGARFSHLVFNGRASSVYDAFGGNGTDCDGHGTHVAGTVGGGTVGVAQGIQIRTAKVLDCNGNGTVGGIIAAVNAVTAVHEPNSVANMSLGSGFSSSFNTAVVNLINSGVFVAVAAGNSRLNACNFSPSSVTQALVVAASDRTDRRASFSNHGSCVDLYAPGVDVWSSWSTGDDIIARISGTSQASPHAAGVAALYKAVNGDVPASVVEAWIVANATQNVISQNKTGTPNRLLFKGGL